MSGLGICLGAMVRGKVVYKPKRAFKVYLEFAGPIEGKWCLSMCLTVPSGSPQGMGDASPAPAFLLVEG